MDAPTRHCLANLVRQRDSGEISGQEFLELLSSGLSSPLSKEAPSSAAVVGAPEESSRNGCLLATPPPLGETPESMQLLSLAEASAIVRRSGPSPPSASCGSGAVLTEAEALGSSIGSCGGATRGSGAVLTEAEAVAWAQALQRQACRDELLGPQGPYSPHAAPQEEPWADDGDVLSLLTPEAALRTQLEAAQRKRAAIAAAADSAQQQAKRGYHYDDFYENGGLYHDSPHAAPPQYLPPRPGLTSEMSSCQSLPRPSVSEPSHEEEEEEFGRRLFPEQSLSRRDGPRKGYPKSPSNTSSLSARRGAGVSGSFCQRDELWQRRKAKRLQEMRRSCDAAEIVECSFRPKLEARDRRKNGADEPPSPVARPQNCSATASEALVERLSTPAWGACRARREVAQWKERRQEEVWRECTFTPDVSQSASSFQLRLPSSGLWDASPRERTGSQTDDEERDAGGRGAATERGGVSKYLEEKFLDFSPERTQRACSAHIRHKEPFPDGGANLSNYGGGDNSGAVENDRRLPFTPQTKGVAAHMVQANLYTRQNVFARLSQPHPEPPTISEASLEASLQTDSLESPPRRDALRRSSRDFAAELSNVAVDHSGGVADRTALDSSAAVAGFLDRQMAFEEVRLRRLYSLHTEHAPSHRPDVNERSRRLAESGERCRRSRGETLGPSYREPLGTPGRRQRRRARSAELAQQSFEESCTFRPQIGANSLRPARSLAELGAGDQRRREEYLTRRREELAADEIREATFAPRIKELPGVTGRLRVQEDPAAYLKRLERASGARLTERERAQGQQARQELQQCTFKPQIRSAPDFVTCMAKSYQTVQGLKEKPVPAPPEWR